MIIWHAPTEPPKECERLLVLINTENEPTIIYFTNKKGDYSTLQGVKDVLAWTEYNMPEWVNSNRKEKE